jgi:hypothetical protein
MKNLLKDKKVIIGTLVILALGYYLYDQKRKADIKSNANTLASTPPTLEATTKKPDTKSTIAELQEVKEM